MTVWYFFLFSFIIRRSCWFKRSGW